MKKAISILLVILFALSACSCSNKDSANSKRFIIEYEERAMFGHDITILRDSETGTAYIYVGNDHSGGLTKLEE